MIDDTQLIMKYRSPECWDGKRCLLKPLGNCSVGGCPKVDEWVLLEAEKIRRDKGKAKRYERTIEIIGEWKRDMQATAEIRRAEDHAVNYNAGVANGLLSAVKNLEERLEKAGFIGSKRACGQTGIK